MNKKLWVLTAVAVFVSASQARAACLNTGFFVDSVEMTAFKINPTTPLTAPVNATGCHIGLYYTNGYPGGVVTLNQAEVYGASHFGVVINADVTASPLTVHLTKNLIHNIGDVPFTSAQHGIGLYIRAYQGHDVTGEATDNVVYGYQKSGIVVNGPNAKLSKLNKNQVFGLGHVSFIAQNGIQVGYGALPYPSEVVGNTVIGNSYIGTTGEAASGILVVGGPGFGACPGGPCAFTKTVLVGINTALNTPGTNLLLNNDIGVFAFNLDADTVSPPSIPTNILIITNLTGSDQAYNQAYMAGISAFGNGDYVLGNSILVGGGYGPSCLTEIDVTGSLNPQVFLNQPSICTAAAAVGPGARLKPSPAAP